MKNYKVIDNNTKNVYWYDTIDEVVSFLRNIDVDFRWFSHLGNYQHGLICFTKKAKEHNQPNGIIFDAVDVVVKNMRRESNLQKLL